MASLASTSPGDRLSDDHMLHIFSYLGPEDLSRSGMVCKYWKAIADKDHLWKAIEKRLLSLFPSLSIIDRTVWETHVDLDDFGLNVEDPLPGEGTQPLSKRATLIPLLRAISTITPLVEGNAGVTLLTIPKGLTFNKLIALAGSPNQGNMAPIYIWNRVTHELGGISVDKTYRVVISNSLLIGSRNQTFITQQELVNGLGCEMPGVLEASTLAIVTYMLSLTCLYSGSPWNYTRCRETINGYRLLVGTIIPAGFLVTHDDDFVNDARGAGIQRKLPDIGT